MAVIENISTERGDVVLIRTDIPIIGLIGLTDFIDDTESDGTAGSFKKEFRYSIDGGLNYTDWLELTTEVLESVELDPSGEFLCEYKYTHIVADGELRFESATLIAELQPKECGPYYKQSVFAEFFGCNDTEVLGWALNVTEKMYREGIVPKYIIREDDSTEIGDRDYINFWRTVATFFAYFVVYARRFQRFYEDENLLREYLRQYGIFTSAYDDISDLNLIAADMVLEARRRGTAEMVRRAPIGERGNSIGVQGELLRLIQMKDSDEFIINTVPSHRLGWCVGQSSPLYKGVHQEDGAAKVFRKEPFTIITDLGFNQDGAIKHRVDPRLDYCLSLDIQVELPEEKSISVGIIAYDEYNNVIDMFDSLNPAEQNMLLEREQLLQTGYHRANFFLYKYTAPVLQSGDIELPEGVITQSDNSCNLGIGNHLRFGSLRIARIAVCVYVDDHETQVIQIKNVALHPLATKFSTGFVQRNNFLTLWLTQRNASLTTEQFENQLRRYFLPYNSSFKITYLDK